MAKENNPQSVPPEESVHADVGRPSGGQGGADNEGIPERVLHGVYWAFRRGEYAEGAAFDQKVRQNQIDVGGEDTWSPDVVVIPCQQIRVVYIRWQGEEELDALVELTGDGREGFTAGELLFKLHNAVAAALQEGDHNFFEGLSLHSHQTPHKPPLYVLHQGS